MRRKLEQLMADMKLKLALESAEIGLPSTRVT